MDYVKSGEVLQSMIADVSFADWWIWNGIPVLLGNFIGGILCTSLLLYLSHKSSLPGLSSLPLMAKASRSVELVLHERAALVKSL
ncbi:hypothetical protein [Paenibacillus sp. URB8-2]|uniref:hypothetical protein n=1 Tax=Paenibacillus sp. URB8-2 TaxID=2741301 RepID=UPI0015BF3292|nr:hypothetical protein [Paenibacillus sp. URB8-2]BCG59156.1 hypothetical protein PUR_25810 [Paenibacillus sp. URB8-2]